MSTAAKEKCTPGVQPPSTAKSLDSAYLRLIDGGPDFWLTGVHVQGSTLLSQPENHVLPRGLGTWAFIDLNFSTLTQRIPSLELVACSRRFFSTPSVIVAVMEPRVAV